MNTRYATMKPSHALPLTQEVYAILDSRIQYMEYQISLKMQGNINAEITPQQSQVLLQYDELMDFITEQTQYIKKLQTLRSWLRDENAKTIFELLQANKYQELESTRLEQLIKTEKYF